MILETTQQLQLPTQLDSAHALQFLQRPELLLAELDFLSQLQHRPDPEGEGQLVSGILTLHVPMLDEVTLPFASRVLPQPGGADLLAQPLTRERAWLAIAGQGHYHGAAHQLWLNYQFHFQAHLQLPATEQWGAKAFEKMVQAAAQRSIARVGQQLPVAFARALEHAEARQAVGH